MNSRLNSTFALLVVGAAALTACGEAGPTQAADGSSPSFAVGDVGAIGTSSTPEYGKVKVCKSSSSNVAGVFSIERTLVGSSGGTFQSTATVQPGTCITVAEDASGSNSGSNVTITETSAGFQSVSAQRIDKVNGTDVVTSEPFNQTDDKTLFVNIFHGFTVTFVNRVDTPPPPPPAVCDFITFGRLVTSSGGKKVVVSGNAGGNKPGGGILGEFHIEFNGVDNHVSDITTYGPITSGPLSGAGFPNARVVTGTAKNGAAVELRLWDGGEPGKNTDYIWFRIGNTSYGPLAIDQGNMQYHPNCRGPK